MFKISFDDLVLKALGIMIILSCAGMVVFVFAAVYMFITGDNQIDKCEYKGGVYISDSVCVDKTTLKLIEVK